MITKQAENMIEKRAFLWKGLWSLGRGIANAGRALKNNVPNGVHLPRLGSGMENFGRATKRFAANEARPLQNSFKGYASSKLNSSLNAMKSMGRNMTAPTAPKAPALNAGLATTYNSGPTAANNTQNALGKIPNFIRNNKIGLGLTAATVPSMVSGNKDTISNYQE